MSEQAVYSNASAESARERATFLHVVTVLSLSSVSILSLMYVVIPLIPVWAVRYESTTSAAVWTASAFSFAYAIGNLFWGTLSDRFSRLRILTIGLFMLAVVTGLVGLSASLGVLIALRGVEGFVAASFPAVALAYVGDVLAPRYRAVAISYISCGFLLAGVLGQLYASTVHELLGWRSVFAGLAAVCFVLAFCMTSLPKGAASLAAKGSLLQTYAQMFRLFRNGRLVIAWLVAVSILLSFVGMYSALAAFVAERFQGDSQTLTWIRAAGIPSILLSVLAGRFIGRFGGKKVAIAGLLLAGAGLVLEGVATTLPALVLSSAVFVLGIAVAVPAMIVLVGQLGRQARGSATAVYAFFIFVGASLGPLLSARLIDYGANVVFFALGGIVFLAALVVWQAIRVEPA